MNDRIEDLAARLYEELLATATSDGWSRTTTRRVEIGTVRTCFARAYTPRSDDPNRSLIIANCLRVLVAQGLITSSAKTDREKVPLPLKVTLAAVAAKSTRTVPPQPHWHRELFDLADAWPTAGPARRARYNAINQWLLSDPDTMKVPFRERALEIFATYGTEADFPVPEKALDDWKTGLLFGEPQRLLTVMRAIPRPPPLLSHRPLDELDAGQFARVGDGNLLIVVENSATWWSIVENLPPIHNVGHVAWGLGSSFIASVRAIEANQEITEIRYFGDLDRTGLSIPTEADTKTHIPVVPAVGLYTDLFTLGKPWCGAEKPCTNATATELTRWLPIQHRSAAQHLLTSGRRIAQEWVGTRHLARTRNWHHDLR
ncbi:Wadjet anti-phage system protein JetD domain-containing protein [Nocardia sp. NPDC058058]|uniref:Wadjet anti-phage system protein JetD domain-containing protein n=1 Tax=Nocardia sp. NPDC058058 TaxID=3346317 RepID=UPI0036DBAE4C